MQSERAGHMLLENWNPLGEEFVEFVKLRWAGFASDKRLEPAW